MQAKHFIIFNNNRRFGTCTSIMHLRPLVASAAVRSKASILLLRIHCLLLLPLFVGVMFLVLILLCSA